MDEIIQKEGIVQTRLPVWHADYRYPGSYNIYRKKIAIETGGQVFTDHGTEKQRGNWKAYFQNSLGVKAENLRLEIGCNAGHVIVEMAEQNPKDAFLGIDWKYKVIHSAFLKAQKKGLKNIVFLRAHAERLPFMFAPSELNEIRLFFPDPWPKNTNQKHRFIQENRLRELALLLRHGGLFHIKTDHQGYFDWMLKAFEKIDSENLFKIVSQNRDIHADNPDAKLLTFPSVTLFERFFIRDGLPICELKLLRNKLRSMV